MTLGREGALLVPSHGEPVVVLAPTVVAVDTVGAGDTFAGALAASLAEGRDLVTSARRAGRGGVAVHHPSRRARRDADGGRAGAVPVELTGVDRALDPWPRPQGTPEPPVVAWVVERDVGRTVRIAGGRGTAAGSARAAPSTAVTLADRAPSLDSSPSIADAMVP